MQNWMDCPAKAVMRTAIVIAQMGVTEPTTTPKKQSDKNPNQSPLTQRAFFYSFYAYNV
jgi:hypothetical protein